MSLCVSTTWCIYLVNISYRLFLLFFSTLCHKETTCTPGKQPSNSNQPLEILFCPSSHHIHTWIRMRPFWHSQLQMPSSSQKWMKRERHGTKTQIGCEKEETKKWNQTRHGIGQLSKRRAMKTEKENLLYCTPHWTKIHVACFTFSCVCIFLRQQLSPRVIIYRFYAHFLSVSFLTFFLSFTHACIRAYVCLLLHVPVSHHFHLNSYDFIWYSFYVLRNGRRYEICTGTTRRQQQ